MKHAGARCFSCRNLRTPLEMSSLQDYKYQCFGLHFSSSDQLLSFPDPAGGSISSLLFFIQFIFSSHGKASSGVFCLLGGNGRPWLSGRILLSPVRPRHRYDGSSSTPFREVVSSFFFFSFVTIIINCYVAARGVLSCYFIVTRKLCNHFVDVTFHLIKSIVRKV